MISVIFMLLDEQLDIFLSISLLHLLAYVYYIILNVFEQTYFSDYQLSYAVSLHNYLFSNHPLNLIQLVRNLAI